MYSLAKGSWKGLQSVIELAGSAALYAGLDAAVTALQSTEQIRGTGVPEWAVLPILFGVRMLANWIKVKKQGPATPPVPEQK